MKHTLIYTFLGVLPPVISFVLLPVFLKYLTTNEYVILSLSNAFFAVFSIVLNLKVDQAFRHIYFFEPDNAAKQLALFRNLFNFQVIIFCFWIFIMYLFGNQLFHFIFKNNFSFFPHTFIMMLSLFVGMLNGFYFLYLQNKFEVRKYSFYFIVNILLTPILQVLCIKVLKLGFLWFLLSSLCANLLVFLLIIFNNRLLFKIEFSRSVIKEALQFSLPFIPFLILYNLENQLDRFFIEKFLSLEDLARYSVLLSISSVIFILFNSLDNAIRPELFSILSNKTEKFELLIQEKMDFYLLVGFMALSFLSAFGINIHWFLNHSKYNGISLYFPIVTLAFLPLILLRFLALILMYENKIKKINYFTAGKIVLMTILFYFLVPELKINGALMTIGISNLLNVCIFYKILHVKILPGRKIYFYITLFALLNSVMLFLNKSTLVSSIAIIQFSLFVLIFLVKYQKELRKQWQLLKII
ncbi:oligosaccharide flippase family protein [Flavobacterium piscis]|uniref:O-antigen/teichoic acid export membrane protein n=1 Tax=Flavobacterium piscis TaxID=1114874 RepID=A0ABU1Y783_9FLAO|nr:oligosaccharide flippase family protein [Flavobacterium piscis]MDR7209371.1 O-antigen/teichoic acid export membrane protein [Flavobacterium piscis]